MKAILVYVIIFHILSVIEAKANASDFKLKINEPYPILKETTLSPAFLIPTSLTLLTFYDDIGKRSSRDIRERHPLWGSKEKASMMSDRLRTLSSISMLASTLVFNKNGYSFMAKNMLFDILASVSAVQARGLISDGGRRTRPNGKERSFPSGHASAAGARIALSNYNIFRSNLSNRAKYSIASINWTIAYITAYSRIESHNHYPEDVFAGIAIGYWVTNIIKKTFTNTYFPDSTLSFLFDRKQEIGLLYTTSF